MEFSTDELILVMISLIRATDPRLLVQGPEGATIDFASLEQKEFLSEDERLLLRLRGALDQSSDAKTADEEESYGVELSIMDRQRLAEVLERLSSLRAWPEDVTEMSRKLHERLLAVEAP